MRVSEIADALDLPRSATYELVNTLAAHQAVLQSDGEVGLGPQMLVLGGAYEKGLDFGQIASLAANDVMREAGETAQVGILDDRSVLYIAKADSNHLVRLVSTVGARLPAHCTALGKVLLANLPEAEFAARMAGVTLEAMTDQSLTDVAELAQELAEVRRQGFATEECESNTDVACVAAPVWDASRRNIAAISISVPIARVSTERMAVLSEVVVAGAARMSAQLGFSPATATP